MDVLARAVAWLNAAANVLGRSVLSPIGMLPGWLSATLVSAITGVLLSNRPIRAKAPSLVDLAPSILAEFGLSTPSGMTGRNMFST